MKLAYIILYEAYLIILHKTEMVIMKIFNQNIREWYAIKINFISLIIKLH